MPLQWKSLCLFVLTLRLAASVLEPEEVKRVNRRKNDILVVAWAWQLLSNEGILTTVWACCIIDVPDDVTDENFEISHFSRSVKPRESWNTKRFPARYYDCRCRRSSKCSLVWDCVSRMLCGIIDARIKVRHHEPRGWPPMKISFYVYIVITARPGRTLASRWPDVLLEIVTSAYASCRLDMMRPPFAHLWSDLITAALLIRR
jgi:hypothetical protein